VHGVSPFPNAKTLESLGWTNEEKNLFPFYRLVVTMRGGGMVLKRQGDAENRFDLVTNELKNQAFVKKLTGCLPMPRRDGHPCRPANPSPCWACRGLVPSSVRPAGRTNRNAALSGGVPDETLL
jgi:hypothetical protein